MVKVRGNIADVARCLEDDDGSVRDAARRFFAEWAKRSVGQNNNVANVALDVTATLLRSNLPLDKFRGVMTFLLGFVEKERHVSSLMERLVLRMAAEDDGSSAGPRVWRGMACCCALLPCHEKALKALAENFASYKSAAACDAECAASLLEALLKQKKGEKGELKAELAEKVGIAEAYLKDVLGLGDEANKDEAANGAAAEADKENAGVAPPGSARKTRRAGAAADADVASPLAEA